MKIAVIGSGISGLTSAYLLSKKYQVDLFEANDYLGGHTHTHELIVNEQKVRIDSGFIVFNDRTYPNFNKLLAEVGVDFQDSEMSFSVTNTLTGREYNGHNLDTLFAQRRNLLSPSFYGFINEILRFNKQAKQSFELGDYNKLSLGDYLAQHQFSKSFQQDYLLAMVAAIWSCSLSDALAMPLKFFVQFFYHHGLLDVSNRPQWHVIKNGSNSYIPKLVEHISGQVHLSTPIKRILRPLQDGVIIETQSKMLSYDKVVIASHSDQALAMLAEPSDAEQQILGKMLYQPNEAIIHTDAAIMPKRKKAWASWNFSIHQEQQNKAPAAITYYMNRLQGLTNTPDIFVSLNCAEHIDATKVIKKIHYHHPLMDQVMVDAQQQKSVINGVNNTWFCGAYWYNGFHEDGVNSALDVCRDFGITLD
jgi:predicted NAD/FAD-binding protein